MSSIEEFAVPTKFHFVSPTGSDVGSVFVDRVVSHPDSTSFYFGKSCVAILDESHLTIGVRQLERTALRREKPFWFDPNEGSTRTPTERSWRVALRRIA